MRWHGASALLVALILGAGGCGRGPGIGPSAAVVAAAAAPAADAQEPENRAAEEPAAPQQFKKVRPAAVAGLFYPRDRDELAPTIDGFLAQVKPSPMGHVRALICPHAGYEFSGPVAAHSFKQLQGRRYRTVIVLGPSHYAYFEGAALPDADAMATPLGVIPVSADAARLAASSPLAVNPPSRVDRPDWWPRSPAASSASGQDTPHTWEHSIEAELPFLQRTLKDFRLVPIVFGDVDPVKVAKAIDKYVDDSTLLVVSSDLSHFYSYDEAKRLDEACVKAICDLDIPRMQEQEACGKGPILTLMLLARARGWKTRLLDCRNSGDTSGEKSRVVGYAAIAFYSDEQAKPSREPSRTAAVYREDQRKLLLELRGNRWPRRPAGKNADRACRDCRGPAAAEGLLRHADHRRPAPRLHRQPGPRGAAGRSGDPPGPQRRAGGPAVLARGAG